MVIVDPVSMTPRQSQRRQAILDAVVALVAERGVDDLQMRDVADRARVSLGTLYRYFTSKDHLVAAAYMSWASGLDLRLARASDVYDRAADPATRLARALRAGVRPFQREPSFARMLIAIGSANDPMASETYLELGRAIRRTLGQAIPDVEPGLREGVLQIVGSVWYHAFVEWMGGRISAGQVSERLDLAAHLLLGREESP